MTLIAALALLISYVVGSIPAAAWVARTRGVDILKVGSGNSGSTNVLRTLGRGPAASVAVFDILKGALAIWLARALGLDSPTQAACGVAAVLGHNFSPFLGFRGGKGVATTFGTICALMPVAGLGFFLMGILTVWLTRFVSAGSILGAVTGAFVSFLLGGPLWLSLLITALVALIVWQHRENIEKLHAGTERRFGEKVGRVQAD